MTLEERVEALEDFMGKMNIQQQEVEAVREIVRKTTNEVIANARRPGGLLNAAHNQAAEFKIARSSQSIRPNDVNAILENARLNVISNA
ncbi:MULTISPECIES: hypothetical protein [Enterobacteriaceae]|uniref:hypothetical protein n=1 Tax=Enterobacteriaceae TaxID=543 RepID=UPI000272B05D|nr:hypothetical protein [Enterobacter sp. Ag1]EJF31686.1 hypothetical protein A936_08838 [Enterobacter sp. Ag1]